MFDILLRSSKIKQERNYTAMGKLKNSLPEDIDITDPRDPGEYPGEVTEPSDVDWAVVEINRSLAILESTPASTTPFAAELDIYANRLANVAQEASVPF